MEAVSYASVQAVDTARDRTVVLTGEVDHSNWSAVYDAIEAATQVAPTADWTIDASQLDFVDTACVTMLLTLDHALEGGPLRVIPTPMLTKLLDTSGLADRFARP